MRAIRCTCFGVLVVRSGVVFVNLFGAVGALEFVALTGSSKQRKTREHGGE